MKLDSTWFWCKIIVVYVVTELDSSLMESETTVSNPINPSLFYPSVVVLMNQDARKSCKIVCWVGYTARDGKLIFMDRVLCYTLFRLNLNTIWIL